MSMHDNCANCILKLNVCMRVQVKLYEDFAKSQAKQEVDEVIEGEGAENKPAPPPTHIFQVMVRSCVYTCTTLHYSACVDYLTIVIQF